MSFKQVLQVAAMMAMSLGVLALVANTPIGAVMWGIATGFGPIPVGWKPIRFGVGFLDSMASWAMVVRMAVAVAVVAAGMLPLSRRMR